MGEGGWGWADQQSLDGLEVGEVLHLHLNACDKADEELAQRLD